MTRRPALALALALGALALSAPAAGALPPVQASWPMPLLEKGGQKLADASGHGNTGWLGNSIKADGNDPQWIGSAAQGDRLTGLRFYSDRYVWVGDSTSLETPQVSIDVWVRASRSPGPFRYVIAKGAQQCVSASYGIFTGADGGLSFYVSDGDGDHVARSPSAGLGIWDGRWHHVAGTFDGATVRLYVDGSETGSGTPTATRLAYDFTNGDDSLYMGGYGATVATCGDTVQGFQGDISAPRIWGGALSAADVAGL